MAIQKKTGVGKSIATAASFLMQDEVVAIPTETVYGLAGNALSVKAVNAIYTAKKRPHSNPLIVHISGIEELTKYAKNIPPVALVLAKAFWPGSLTLILKKKKNVPDAVTAGTDTVALRIPNHPITQKLLQQLSFPLAAPSANPFNYVSPVTANHVMAQLNGKISYILDGGRCKAGVESTIIGFIKGKPVLLRHGAITKESIEAVLGYSIEEEVKEVFLKRPGMFKKHYSPHTKLIVAHDVMLASEHYSGKNIGYITFAEKVKGVVPSQQVQLSKSKKLEQAAHNIYDALINMDSKGFDIIIAEWLPDEGLGKAINERLRKASAK